MKTFVDLSTLTDGSRWTRKGVFGVVPTAGDYPLIVDTADKLDWYWYAITTPEHIAAKRRFHDQYSLARNKLIVVDDFRDVVSDAILISRCLNSCRLFCATGRRALWVDYPKFIDVSGSNAEFLAKCAAEVL
jgi:hypothetical protein